MTHFSHHVKVPGKLLIAGEYAVLEPDQQAIVVAINRYVTASIEPAEENHLSLLSLGLERIMWETNGEDIQFSVEDPRLNFIRNSILVVDQFLREKSISPSPFQLSIKSELNDPATGKKYGFGSSAAVVIAVVSAMLALHGNQNNPPSQEQIFKLSAIAHFKTQKNGSGADIAASTFGGWLAYSAFDSGWLVNEIAHGQKLTELLKKKWPGLSVTSIQPPKPLKLGVGWTGEPVSTAVMIKKIDELKLNSPDLYREFLNTSANAVSRILTSFRLTDCSEAIAGLRDNRQALKKLEGYAGCLIETPKLTKLCTIAEQYGSGKSSGAGGGDCGIAFLTEADQLASLFERWNDHSILPLKITVSQTGAFITNHMCESSLF